MYVLDQLEKRIFNNEALPKLVEMLNEYKANSNSKMSEELSDLQNKLEKNKKQRANIIKAIEDGLPPESLKARMSELEEEKNLLEISIKQLKIKNATVKISEETLQ